MKLKIEKKEIKMGNRRGHVKNTKSVSNNNNNENVDRYKKREKKSQSVSKNKGEKILRSQPK